MRFLSSSNLFHLRNRVNYTSCMCVRKERDGGLGGGGGGEYFSLWFDRTYTVFCHFTVVILPIVDSQRVVLSLSTKTECHYLYSWIFEKRKKRNGHIRRNLTKSGEPQRSSWGCRRRSCFTSIAQIACYGSYTLWIPAICSRQVAAGVSAQ